MEIIEISTTSGIFKVTPSSSSDLEILSTEDSDIICKRNLFEVTCEESSFNKGICVLSDKYSLLIPVKNK